MELIQAGNRGGKNIFLEMTSTPKTREPTGQLASVTRGPIDGKGIGGRLQSPFRQVPSRVSK